MDGDIDHDISFQRSYKKWYKIVRTYGKLRERDNGKDLLQILIEMNNSVKEMDGRLRYTAPKNQKIST